MLDISVIILTYNEELHIRRCIENVSSFAKEIFVIESFSTDKTVGIAQEYENVQVLQNKWENQYAKQFNWGLEHAPITAKWVLRLDADEYLMPELIRELEGRLPLLEPDITGVVFKRRHIFLNKWMKRGIYPVKLLRLFQYGKGICEQRLMDEHIQLWEGDTVEFEHDIVDHNLNNLSWACHKYVNYAIREAIDLLDIELDLTGSGKVDENKDIGRQARDKRMKKRRYAKQPLFWRSFAYFGYRYFLRGGFLDGRVGFIFNFLTAWWYRMLVDTKVYEIRQECGTDRSRIVAYVKSHYDISI